MSEGDETEPAAGFGPVQVTTRGGGRMILVRTHPDNRAGPHIRHILPDGTKVNHKEWSHRIFGRDKQHRFSSLRAEPPHLEKPQNKSSKYLSNFQGPLRTGPIR